jgi:flavin-dependent dehydrogenase
VIGDAAGHVNPITGEGIYYAMNDGKLAANAYLNGELSLFENYWRKKYGSDMYLGARIKKIVYKQAIISRLIKAAIKDKAINEIMGDIIASRKPYNKVIPRLVLNLPRLVI